MCLITKRKLILSFMVITLVLLVTATQSDWLRPKPNQGGVIAPGFYTVTHFVDGDTLIVDMNGKDETVRFIGVDTPETHKPNTPVQCYGPEAADYTKELISSSQVRLQADPLDTNRDRYGRLLRYIYLPDGRMVEEELIKNGFGFAYTSFPFEKKLEFANLEKTARDNKAGLWAVCQPVLTKYGTYQSNAL